MTPPLERGLAKTRRGVRLRPHRPLVGERDVEIAVVCAGICRTDLHVAAGRIPTADGRILGHELSGRVVDVGGSVARFAVGDRVTVFPIVGCGRCTHCGDAEPWHCRESEMLGVGRDGAFGDRLVVPERAVHRLPNALSFELGAYAEPVAASLAVTKADLDASGAGVILGRDRIAELTRRVLAAHGVDAPLHDPARGELPHRSCDFVVETVANEEAFDLALAALRPGGTLVLKSRPAVKVPFDVGRAVARELTVRAVAYGPFDDALALLSGDALFVDDLLGPSFDLADHERAFSVALRDESRKVFLKPAGPR